MAGISTGPMAGQTVLVTGGTGGIGRATATGLAAMDARVGITGRDVARTRAAAADVAAASGNPAVDPFPADMSSQAEVRRLAGEVLAVYPRLDVLVNNQVAITRLGRCSGRIARYGVMTRTRQRARLDGTREQAGTQSPGPDDRMLRRAERRVLSGRNRSRHPDVTMTSAVPRSPLGRGVPSLEVRWILPGRLDTAVLAWFATSVAHTESREDAYLLRPDLGGLSVKVRGGRALEVKMFLGSPGILDLQGRARGRMQYWQKWSFPFGSLSQDSSEADGWRRVRKQRSIIRFASTGRCITPAAASAVELVDEARCAVELTELRTQHRDWWSLGLEATGPAGLLRAGLEATAALVFTQAPPGGSQLGMADSMSYAEWLRPRLRTEGHASA